MNTDKILNWIAEQNILNGDVVVNITMAELRQLKQEIKLLRNEVSEFKKRYIYGDS